MTLVSLVDLIAGARAGLLVSFPTDTVPALAARPEKAPLIFEAKQRSQDKPLILMGASREDLWPYVQGSENELKIWQSVADRHWPGALTLVLPASDRVPKQMNPTNPTTIGIRVPNSTIAQAILAQTGPLATTSANFSGRPPLQKLAEIAENFPEVLTLEAKQFNAETASIGVPSTVGKWTGTNWQILRQGTVKLSF
ncbi:L-threonylcarbamoyladenylate synthase [Umezakia ovalisporum]|jgi:L-threonylcarbamoyladenylate synthase|uniref:L-threonylcarbamoyladenylate synthase n=2 Tax=Umezakia ovalisporum TaxID=75695 RepID=A0AA43GWT8_9CYAN|nr:L-threonylcarbamoyladenylate synthase [Umezakia ovalisporum]MBI1242616.1 Sua5/YciO/YrdC/YwlC family protein [Nostoc sp. RI_552]MDH6057943.1 L-threonylcarbamoyladenylate synthase [Umezakia ovalisporum FSS-43]MDH6063025.1 L-threonylcarbamoyladenylate synthase [Umezakia ovalisporum FSS-62]MDH6066864.1 L-threonylcarbamoyladenylate synthase [Umezakia ovalisporum APH033B]MDH6071967.1 L-threonylcarbamoyladenylate synthase [Umezakia ovalisporum CobakiLakeA]